MHPNKDLEKIALESRHDETILDQIQYDAIDFVVPALALRHMRKIGQIRDDVVRKHETGVLLLYISTQAVMYYNAFF